MRDVPDKTPVRTRRTRRRWLAVLLMAVPMAGAYRLGQALADRRADDERRYVWAQAEGARERPDVGAVAGSRNTDRTPESVADLRAVEADIEAAVAVAVPATVGIQVGAGQGSGVIVSDDGLILTAAHVSGPPGRAALVTLPDGRRLRARTLGRLRDIDAGMAVIEDERAFDDGPLPFAALGRSGELPVGSWTVAVGHPGGYQSGRPPVVRVGRLNDAQRDLLQTDNTLVGGDSGGPLFDLDGRVIGIHSRIGDSTRSNVHVPVDRFVEEWALLTGGGERGGFVLPDWMRQPEGEDGIRLDFDGLDDGLPGAPVASVLPGSPADDAGIRPGDRVIAAGGEAIDNEVDLMLRRSRLRPGESVRYGLLRDRRRVDVTVEAVASDALEPAWEEWPGGRSGPTAPHRGVIGIELAQAGGFGQGGAGVAAVTPGGPADRAGVRGGESIVGVAGVDVADPGELQRLLLRLRGGDRVALRLRRQDGSERDAAVTLANRGDLYGRRD